MTSVAEVKDACRKRKFIETPEKRRPAKYVKDSTKPDVCMCVGGLTKPGGVPITLHEDELCEQCYYKWRENICERCSCCFALEDLKEGYCEGCRKELDSACPTCWEIYTPKRPQAGHVCEDQEEEEEEGSEAEDAKDEYGCSGACGHPAGKCRCTRLAEHEEAIIARFTDPALRNVGSHIGPDWDKLVSTANIVLALAKAGQREQNVRREIA